MKYLKRTLGLLVCAGTLTSTLMFIGQGGFGGGHLRFDRLLYVLGLPWILLPFPKSLMEYGFIWVVAIPWIMNGLLLLIIARCYGRIRQVARK
jgi:hypothetical protein